MPRSPVPEPDSSQPNADLAPGAGAGLPNSGPNSDLDAEFADLAARFSSHSGGGLPPDLSADLALEIVLNEIVEQACLTTGATGAAIVLERGGELVCRARSGENAPDLGSRLDPASGLSGECIRTRQIQRCDDAFADPRVDRTACAHLGIRSLMVMPLVRPDGGELVGVFEVFSPRTEAFGERDAMTLGALAERVLRNLRSAEQAPDLAASATRIMQGRNIVASSPENAVPDAEPNARIMDQPDSTPSRPEVVPDGIFAELAPAGTRRGDAISWILGVAVVLCAVALGIVLSRHLGFGGTGAKNAVPPATTASAADAGKTMAAGASASSPSETSTRGDDQVPPGGLAVFENGKEVFRLEPKPARESSLNSALPAPVPGKVSGQKSGTGLERASTVEKSTLGKTGVVKLSRQAAESEVLRRVEPEYPEGARDQKVQGAVVLLVRAGTDGAVQDIQIVSGPAPLLEPSVDAVKQWRFKPRMVHGHAAEMETRITLNFRLPQ